MLQFLGVTKKYSSGIAALEEVSFDINEGEFVFMVGPSGSGKTTIIKLLIREENPSNGKIFFDQDDITKYNRSKIYKLRRKVGVIFQDFKLINEMSAYENVAFAMEAAGRSEKEIKENVPYLLDIVGLSNRVKSFPSQLSGGEKQRVAIARAMANNPKLLIADEPTGNLDPDSAWDIVQILSKINNWGTTVVMSTHGSDIVNTLHKRVIRLEDGKLIRDDFKGGYNLDDFSLKIISAQNKAKENKEKIVVKDSSSEIKAVKEEKSSKLHQKANKKITFSTKKKKPKEDNKVESKFENDILGTISNDIDVEDIKDTPVIDLKLTKKTLDLLASNEIITLSDLKDEKEKLLKLTTDKDIKNEINSLT